MLLQLWIILKCCFTMFIWAQKQMAISSCLWWLTLKSLPTSVVFWQTLCYRQAWSGSKLFNTMIVFLKSIFINANFLKNQQTAQKHVKFPSMQRVKRQSADSKFCDLFLAHLSLWIRVVLLSVISGLSCVQDSLHFALPLRPIVLCILKDLSPFKMHKIIFFSRKTWKKF